jgi:hypothetical protein
VIQDTTGWLTVHDVARQMQVVLSDAQAWRVGSRMASAWEYVVGSPPVKDLRTKKLGTGSHCFALYPPVWRERVERFIRAEQTALLDQGELSV